MSEQITNRRRVLVAFLSDITCGEACWHAREETCRCSCGGKNHGCLLEDGAISPARTSKIDGKVYELVAVGVRGGLYDEAKRVNEACSPYSSQPMVQDGKIIQRYHYTWGDTDTHAPARIKYATAPQISKWPELRAWLDKTERPCLLWRRMDVPNPRYCPDDGCEKCNALKKERAGLDAID